MKSIWLAVSVFIGVATLCSTASPDEPDKPARPAADPMIGKEPGQVRDDNGLKMKLVWCPPGSFTMESVEPVEPKEPIDEKENVDPTDELDLEKGDDPNNDEAGRQQPQGKVIPVKVFLTKGYWLGKYEVTQAEWQRVMNTQPWKGMRFTKDGAEIPVTYVTCHGAADFCRKFTEQERNSGRLSLDWEYRLPTEAQWERACRARTDTKFSFGDDESKFGDFGWFLENGGRAKETNPRPVGQKKANPWGLCDMHGNVWELCNDRYTWKLPGGRDPEVTLPEIKGDLPQVRRGGSWQGPPKTSSYRSVFHPVQRFHDTGFRVALSAVRRAKPVETGVQHPETNDK